MGGVDEEPADQPAAGSLDGGRPTCCSASRLAGAAPPRRSSPRRRLRPQRRRRRRPAEAEKAAEAEAGERIAAAAAAAAAPLPRGREPRSSSRRAAEAVKPAAFHASRTHEPPRPPPPERRRADVGRRRPRARAESPPEASRCWSGGESRARRRRRRRTRDPRSLPWTSSTRVRGIDVAGDGRRGDADHRAGRIRGCAAIGVAERAASTPLPGADARRAHRRERADRDMRVAKAVAADDLGAFTPSWPSDTVARDAASKCTSHRRRSGARSRACSRAGWPPRGTRTPPLCATCAPGTWTPPSGTGSARSRSGRCRRRRCTRCSRRRWC